MSSLSAQQILDREFLEVRAKILEIAASFDRIDRAEGSVGEDSRRQRLASAINVVLEPGTDRAERIQRIFSRDYAPEWQTTFQLK